MKIFHIFPIILASFFNSCTPNNVTTDDSTKQYFDENKVTGCFALYDNGQNQFTIYNLPRYRDSSYLPASTFDIISSLIGIETGIISNETAVTKVADLNDTIMDWQKQDIGMQQAFTSNTFDYYYRSVDRNIGKDTIQFWLDSLHYGTAKIRTSLDKFWSDNSLKITPDEQLGLVEKLYFNKLPFQKRTQDIVKKIMLRENNANYKLSYKTGLGFLENGDALGWIVGWIEENQHPYFFVLNTQASRSQDPKNVSVDMLKEILKSKGFFLGKK